MIAKKLTVSALAALGIFAVVGTAVTATSTTPAFADACDDDKENGRPAGCDGNPHSGPTKDGGNPHHPPNDEGNPHFCPPGQEDDKGRCR